jgi:hypothetical protein
MGQSLWHRKEGDSLGSHSKLGAPGIPAIFLYSSVIPLHLSSQVLPSTMTSPAQPSTAQHSVTKLSPVQYSLVQFSSAMPLPLFLSLTVRTLLWRRSLKLSGEGCRYLTYRWSRLLEPLSGGQLDR